MVSVLINEMSPMVILFNILFVYCFENNNGKVFGTPSQTMPFPAN